MCFSVLHKVYINPMVVCVHCICTHTKMRNRLIKAKIKCNILTLDIFFNILCMNTYYVCVYIYKECIYASTSYLSHFHAIVCMCECVYVFILVQLHTRHALDLICMCYMDFYNINFIHNMSSVMY